MRKNLFFAIILLVVTFSTSSCLSLSEEQKKDYGLLESAVTFSSDKVYGEYGDSIPDDFNSNKFLQLVKDKIPDDYYGALKKYNLNVFPKSSYYLLTTYDEKKLILFDYSCTSEVDGPVLLEAEKYDLNHLELYDSCK